MTEKSKGGRPLAEIDQKQFENLCRLQCTKEEVCGWFGVTDKTLERWCKRTYKRGFSEVFREKRQGGKISLRRNQLRLSETNATMAIWLGKQYLGQRETVEVEAGNRAADLMKSILDVQTGKAVIAKPIEIEEAGPPEE